MLMRATVVIDWESDDKDPTEIERQYKAREFCLEDLLKIADKLEVTFSERKANDQACPMDHEDKADDQLKYAAKIVAKRIIQRAIPNLTNSLERGRKAEDWLKTIQGARMTNALGTFITQWATDYQNPSQFDILWDAAKHFDQGEISMAGFMIKLQDFAKDCADPDDVAALASLIIAEV